MIIRTFLKASNDSKGQGCMIIGMMTNDHPWDGGHPWDSLGDFDQFGVGDFPWDDDHPKNGDHPICGHFLRDFFHPKGLLLSFPPKIRSSKV